MKTKGFLLILLMMSITTMVFADEAAAPAETSESAQVDRRSPKIWHIFGYEDALGEHHHLESDFLDWFHNPAEGIQMGFDVRLRTIWAEKIDTLAEKPAGNRSRAWEFQRYRMRWWQKFMLDEDTDFNMRWITEFRTWDEPDRKDRNVDFGEIMPDRFNLTVRNFMDMPLTMIAGRQDIILGGGWLVLDGTPLDGSRTIFLDALRFIYDMPEQDSKLDVSFVSMNASTDAWLEAIDDQQDFLTEQDEHGVIVWLTNKSMENTTLEGFYIYKNDNKVDHPASNFPAALVTAWSRKAEIHTLGFAVSGNMDENWSYRTDFAAQYGDRQMRTSSRVNDLEAYGVRGKLKYAFNDEQKSEAHIGYEYLSGDDPDSTNKDEAFDPLWGEWPQWSELMVYVFSRENAIGEATNFHRANVGYSFKPHEKLTVCTDYHALWGAEDGTGALSAGSGDRFMGHLLTAWLKYNCCNKLRAHAVLEYFFPGAYFSKATNDEAYFLRLNLEYSF